MNYNDIPKQPANLAKVNKTFAWPNEKKSCLFLSFDLDAETGWIDESADDWKNKVALSHGGYAARVGTPKLLELLSDLELSATFFIPGWVVQAHTDLCEQIVNAGHEVGHHGTYHLEPEVPISDQSIEEIDMAFEIFEKLLGLKPIGYRAPLGENSYELLNHLQKNGIGYSSSWRDDILPYRHVLKSGVAGPVELPANYFFDDWMHGMIKGSQRNLVSRENVLSMWMDELEITHEWGGLLGTILHPQVSGRPSRFKILREFLSRVKTNHEIWNATGEDVYNHYVDIEPTLNENT